MGCRKGYNYRWNAYDGGIWNGDALLRNFRYKNFIKSDVRKRNREKRYIQEEMQAFKSQASITIDKYVESRLVWKEVMDKLNDYEQSLLVYYLQAELTVREIAEVLHKPKSTIENHLQKVKEKIRKMK